MRTTSVFNKDLAKAQKTGIESRSLFKELAEDALAFYLADGPSRNDTGRLNMLLTAAENVKMINTTALAAWIKAHAPVTVGLDEHKHFVVKHDKKKALDFDYTDEAYKDIPFWEYRKDTEKPAFVLDKSVADTIKRWVKAGATPEQILTKVGDALGFNLNMPKAEEFIGPVQPQ